MQQPEGENAARSSAKPEVMLFILAIDRGEQDNLAAAKLERVARLRQRMIGLDAALVSGAGGCVEEAVG
jgi:hypothetical protein